MYRWGVTYREIEAAQMVPLNWGFEAMISHDNFIKGESTMI